MYNDILLPRWWRLNRARVPPPPLLDRPTFEAEVRRRLQFLPPTLHQDHSYHRRDVWRAFFAWEHEARLATTEVRDF
jgi:hypothetical protein